MKYPSVRLVYDRKKEACETKPALIQIEVVHERKKKYISTGVKVYPRQWKNNTIQGRMDALELMERINKQVKRLHIWLNDLDNNGEDFSFEKLTTFIETQNKTSGRFLDFIEKKITERGIRTSTQSQHYVLLSALEDFGRIIMFSDITLSNIKLFDDYLRAKGISQPTIHSYHKRLKTYINEAMKYETVKSNPYQNFSVPKGETINRKYLTDEELSKVEKAEIADKSIDKARDCFVFCCYTGLAYSDLLKFDWKTHVREINGKHFIEDSRQKTNTAYKIQILSPAMRILQKYDYQLPVITNQKYNYYLKIVSKYAEIDKPLTSHMARHTFAVWALNNGVRIEVVSRMLAHSDIKTTQIYAKILQKEVEHGFDLLEEKINK